MVAQTGGKKWSGEKASALTPTAKKSLRCSSLEEKLQSKATKSVTSTALIQNKTAETSI